MMDVDGMYIIQRLDATFLHISVVFILTYDVILFQCAEDDEANGLPTTIHEEYRPFMRRLPEFQFW
jgi:hypothetical protein